MNKKKDKVDTGNFKRLQGILKSLQSVVVAYSGGLDSTFLLKVAIDTLGTGSVLAVTARSETYPRSELNDARCVAQMIGARHIIIRTTELTMKSFRSNPVNRCYYCKKELFKRLDAIRKKQGLRYVIDGTNFNDLKDIRHGTKAAEELGVRRPLLEANITKEDIRSHSRTLKLPTWDKPSAACLASRIPFGIPITLEKLDKVARAEEALHGIGFRQVRVRLHGDIARIELTGRDITRAIKSKDLIVKTLNGLGFIYVTLDLAGYRTGSLHESVK